MKIVDWILGREPVATTTGLAAVVTAALGLAATFGLDITPEQIAAVGALCAALAGWAARRVVSPVMTPEERQVDRQLRNTPTADGQLGILVAIAVVLILAMVGLFAICGNDDGDPSGLARVTNHEGGDPCWDYGACGGGYDERNGGSGDSRGGDGRYGGGRSGDYDGGPGDDCRNACGNTIIVPTPGDRSGQNA